MTITPISPNIAFVTANGRNYKRYGNVPILWTVKESLEYKPVPYLEQTMLENEFYRLTKGLTRAQNVVK